MISPTQLCERFVRHPYRSLVGRLAGHYCPENKAVLIPGLVLLNFRTLTRHRALTM
jgi:hypothetical protein